MDYWDILDAKSYEDRVAESEFWAECQREDEQLKYLEEKENV